MYIIKTKKYIKDYTKKIVQKHLEREEKTIEMIELAMFDAKNLKELIHSDAAVTYSIEKKTGDLKERYTARINKKIRLHIKPIGEYPYNNEEIVEVEFIEIDDRHYGEG